MSEPVAKRDPLGLFDDRLCQVGRDEDHPLALGEHDVAGQHGHVPDADRSVEPHQHHVPDRRGIPAADERVETLDLGEPLEVADRAVEDNPVARLGEDGIAEVVADQGPVVNLAETVGHVHIPALEGVDRPGIHGPDAALLVSALENPRGQLGACRHVLGREGAADHRHVVVNRLPVSLELPLVAVRAQVTPCLLDRDLTHPGEDLVRHPGTAVRESLPFPFGREEDELVARKGLRLGRHSADREDPAQEHGRRGRDEASLLSIHCRPDDAISHIEMLLSQWNAERWVDGTK